MALQTPNIFYINDIIFKINEYIIMSPKKIL